MAREVNNVLAQILAEQRSLPEGKGEELVKAMRSANQYQVRRRHPPQMAHMWTYANNIVRRMSGHESIRQLLQELRRLNVHAFGIPKLVYLIYRHGAGDIDYVTINFLHFQRGWHVKLIRISCFTHSYLLLKMKESNASKIFLAQTLV